MTAQPVKPEEPTVEELVDELEDAYELIICALPLALELLRKGAVPLHDQRAFWRALEGVDGHVTALEPSGDSDYVLSSTIEDRIHDLFALAHRAEE